LVGRINVEVEVVVAAGSGVLVGMAVDVEKTVSVLL
jgi:hypothetical protein